MAEGKSSGLKGALGKVRDALLSISAYQPPNNPAYGPDLYDKVVEEIREYLGGQLQAAPNTRLRWYIADLDTAQIAADDGNMTMVAQLHRAMKRDGVLAGLYSTRTSGLVRLPKKFYGNEEIKASLEKNNLSRSVFDEMIPASELSLLLGDGIGPGFGIAELVPVPGRNYPVMVRLDPEYLQYIWSENRWYFRSMAGRLPITPGDGRWVFHAPGGRLAPWNSGIWAALGRSFINKEHAILRRSNFSATLANPARLAYAPQGATDKIRMGFFKKIAAWGTNTVIELPPGYEAKILETTGRGWEIFQKEIETCDNEYMVALAGQIVTTTGGAGFQNSDIHRTIRGDLIKATGDDGAYTVNTQILPQYIVDNYSLDALINSPCYMGWETDAPKDREAEARAIIGLANAIKALDEALAAHQLQANAKELLIRFGVPWLDGIATPPMLSAGPNAPTPLPKDQRPAPTPEGKARAEMVLAEAA